MHRANRRARRAAWSGRSDAEADTRSATENRPAPVALQIIGERIAAVRRRCASFMRYACDGPPAAAIADSPRGTIDRVPLLRATDWRSARKRREFSVRRTLVSVAKIWHGELGQYCCPSWRHAPSIGRAGRRASGERQTGAARRLTSLRQATRPSTRPGTAAPSAAAPMALRTHAAGLARADGSSELIEAKTRDDDGDAEAATRRARRRAGRARRVCACRSALRRHRRSRPARRRRASTIRALDKDSCGVGFIADIKGRKSHQIVEDALAILLQSRASRRGRRRSARRRRRRHPGADPAQVLRRARPSELGFTLPEPGDYARRRRCSCRATRTGGRSSATSMPRRSPRRGPDAARLARRADRQFDARRIGEADRAVPHAGVHRPRQEDQRPRTSSSAGSTSCARSISDAIYQQRERRLSRLLPGVDVVPHGRLQGHVPRRPARHLLSRPARRRTSRARSRWCTSASRPTRSRPGRWRIPTG